MKAYLFYIQTIFIRLLSYGSDSKQLEKDMMKVLVKHHNEHSFRAMQGKIISGLAGFLTNWLASCFTRYSEEEFHKKMATSYKIKDTQGRVFEIPGFNFIEDWKVNHGTRWKTFIFNARLHKNHLNLDEQGIMSVVDNIVRQKKWTLTENERKGIYYTANRLKNIIYHKVDTISFS